MSILRRECASIQEVIERTEMSYTKPEPNTKNGIRTEIAEQKQQEVYETAMSTRVRSKSNTIQRQFNSFVQ